jgi:hypothetical protein
VPLLDYTSHTLKVHTIDCRLPADGLISSYLMVGIPRGTRVFSYEGMRQKGSAGTIRGLNCNHTDRSRSWMHRDIGAIAITSSSFDNRGRTDRRPTVSRVLKLHSLCHLPLRLRYSVLKSLLIFCPGGGKNLQLREWLW